MQECVRGPDLAVSADFLYARYDAWCREHGCRPLQKTKAFMVAMTGLGFHEFFEDGQRVRRGLGVKTGRGENVAPPAPVLQAADREGLAWKFLRLLRAALDAQHCHVASRYGGRPGTSNAWGWDDRGSRGLVVGWLDDEHLYLAPAAAVRVAAAEAKILGESFGGTKSMVSKALRTAGLLVEFDNPTRGTYMVRRTIAGKVSSSVWSLVPGDVR